MILKNLGYSEQASTAYELVSSIIAEVNAPEGIVAVYGNHDRWTIPKFCHKQFTSRQIRILINESIELNRSGSILRLIGVDDYWTGIPRIPKLPVRTKNSKEVRILISHNPDFLSPLINQRQNIFDLGLCGHTHGGQIKLPVVGALHYNIRDLRLSEGLYQNDYCSVYTTRGVGVVEIPYRVNCNPEVSILNLTRA